MRATLPAITARVISCRACPRLVAWREEAAAQPPRRFRGERYWARPVPGFGDPAARLFVVGLAPAAHGGNRTGRIFTGDSSGNFLFAALYRTGFSNQPTSVGRDDGLELRDVYVAAAARCAPPDNRPTPEEFERCRHFLEEEIGTLRNLSAFLLLGALAWESTLKALATLTYTVPRPRPAFSHGARVAVGPYTLFGSYHVSQQNTNTGKLTPAMFDRVLLDVRASLSRTGS